MPPFSNLKQALRASLGPRVRNLQAGLSITHLHGPRRVETSPDEAVVTCVLKNGEFYLDQFVDHYRSKGFKHICFLDNGSSDGTVQRAMKHSRVTIYRCTMAVSDHQGLLKKQIAERIVRAGWCLDVDVDEFFDYPYSDRLPLSGFLRYLNDNGYTAVMTQMLDMFSDQPLSALGRQSGEELKRVHRYYDISQVRRVPYFDDALTRAHGQRNTVANPDAALYWGGIRRMVYGIEWCLTKHSLFQTGAGLDLFPHVHYVNNARIADVSGLLLHYKFAGNAIAEAERNVGAFTAGSDGYSRVVDTLTRRPDVLIKTGSADEFTNATDLLAKRFVFASEGYRAFVDRENATRSST